jgi:hypothetical protein
MHQEAPTPQRQLGLMPGTRSLIAAAFVAALLSASHAQARTAATDSFFDVFVDISNNSQVNMVPVDSGGAFPFPPPPLDFPDLPTDSAGTVDIEMVSLSLQSVAPMIVSPPDPSGNFFVDSFFDIHYELNVTGNTGNPTHVVDSFFDVSYSMLVTPLVPQVNPDGSETRVFQTEIVSMSLSGTNPIFLPGDQEFDLGLDLRGNGQTHHGHVTVLKIAAPGGGGGDFNVDSFFDVFVELHIDGNGPIPSSQNSPLRLQSSNTGVPEPASLALLGLGGLMLAGRRR